MKDLITTENEYVNKDNIDEILTLLKEKDYTIEITELNYYKIRKVVGEFQINMAIPNELLSSTYLTPINIVNYLEEQTTVELLKWIQTKKP